MTPVTKSGHQRLKDAEIGCCRTHMNAIRMVVEQNLEPALVLEDDADWDVRIKDKLHDLSLATRTLTQPLANPDGENLYADSTYPIPQDKDAVPESDFNLNNPPSTVVPKKSPYGDCWDLIWMGHCGMRFPADWLPSPEKIPKGRVVIPYSSVPEVQFLQSVQSPEDLAMYPNHTRVVAHVSDPVCPTGYAIIQAGARRLLHDIGLVDVNTQLDVLLREFCEGTNGRNYHNCLTTNPALSRQLAKAPGLIHLLVCTHIHADMNLRCGFAHEQMG